MGKTIRISDEVWNVLNRMGYTSDSFDDVLKGILKQFRDSNTISETNREIIDKCLKEITPEKHGKKGIEIEGHFTPLQFSYGILIKIGNLLIENGWLKEKDIPYSTGHKRFLINKEPVHMDGSSFRQPKKLMNGWYIETHSSVDQTKKYAKELIENFAPEDTNVEVKGF